METVIEVVEDLMAREQPERCLYVGVKGLPIGPARPDAVVRPLEPLEAEARR